MGAEVGGIDYDSSNALYPGAVFPEGPDESFCTTEVLLVEKDGEELEEESGNQTDRELEALAIAGETSGRPCRPEDGKCEHRTVLCRV